MISICRIVVATNAVKYHTGIGQTPNFDRMQYINVLGELKMDYNAYFLLKKETSSEVSFVSDKYK